MLRQALFRTPICLSIVIQSFLAYNWAFQTYCFYAFSLTIALLVTGSDTYSV
jgi:hypothetical protein